MLVASVSEISTLSLTPPARPLLQHNGDVIVATTRFGGGAVFAVGEPWLYNEYVDGRKLPAELENCEAARDLPRWLLQQSAPRRK